MNKIKQLKKSKNLTLNEIIFLIEDYETKNQNKKISKKDYKELMFLYWLYKKTIHNEALQLNYAIKNKIGSCPSIPNLKTYCNNDKNKIAHIEKNQTNFGVKKIFQNLYITTYEHPQKQNKTKNKKQVIVKKNFNNDIKEVEIKKNKTKQDNFYQDIKNEVLPYIQTLLNNGYDLQYIDNYIKENSFGVLSLADFI